VTEGTAPGARTILIDATKRSRLLSLRELRGYRELVYFLVWRDIKVRYKQTLLGAGWAVLQPLATTLIFALFFGRLAKIPSQGVPYTLFALTGLVLWTLFSQSVSGASQSVTGAANVITKVYFPRVLVPLASAASFIVDFAIALVIMFVFLLAYGRPPRVEALVAPVFMLISLAAALGVSLWLSALNVRYRDVKYAIPFVIQLWLFSSPVAYPSTLLSHNARLLYAVNPMSSAIDGFRWSFLGTPAPSIGALLISAAVAVAALLAGLAYFQKMEETFADVV
jgi:lipopolysaccharide transport system permease protein